ncbi:H-type small acid-soluble spore protein [Lentibacillus sp. CBA3610]|uniref:H-type small acid-soluble spore protein n=1 Tax=Lentibacillus sp. CBA3610 TaxID=2518176 RepID=UPI0015952E1B|nr:H-type small acid-soluble spore protein [Lentibacillus sp. CBA3610]QKY70749.1 H-type small acid-soluble spore protein [Lentibacillus sp. CBA3610]
MDQERAQDIINSITMINVKYHGFPVYLKEINPDQETATVFPLDEMDHEQDVDLNGLFEDGP